MISTKLRSLILLAPQSLRKRRSIKETKRRILLIRATVTTITEVKTKSTKEVTATARLVTRMAGGYQDPDKVRVMDRRS